MYTKKGAPMLKIIAPLTVKQVNAITKEGFTVVSGAPGLNLLVRGLSLSWVYRYKSPETGRPTMKSIGSCSSMILLAARAVAQELAATVKSGIDPTIEKRRQKQKLIDEAEQEDKATFKQACEEWLQSRLDAGYYSDGERSAYRVRQILKNHLYPAFGDKPISELTAADLFEFLKPFHRGVSRILCPGSFSRAAKLTALLFNDSVCHDCVGGVR